VSPINTGTSGIASPSAASLALQGDRRRPPTRPRPGPRQLDKTGL
jgi:hypothetical protein